MADGTNENPPSWGPPPGVPTPPPGSPPAGSPPPPPPGGPTPPPPGQPPAPPSWGAPPPNYGAQPPSGPSNDGMAIASLVCGIASLLCCGGFPLGIVAIVLGSISKKKIRESNGTIGGAGMAQWGFILGIVGLVFAVILIVIWILVLVFGDHTSTTNDPTFNTSFGLILGSLR